MSLSTLIKIKLGGLVLLAHLAATGVQATEKVRVALASNFHFAMEDLKREFTRKTGIEVLSVSGASGLLVTQIRNGSPIDVFISADMASPDSLHAWGFASDKPKIYAYGKLVVWTMEDIELNRDLRFLMDPSIKKIVLADPASAPYGLEAVQALKMSGVYEKVIAKVIYGQNVGKANQYVLNRNVSTGFTAKSVVTAGEMKNRGRWMEVDSTLYNPIAQGAVICKHGAEKNPKNTQRFYRFLYSRTARDILRGYGYTLP